MSQMFIETESSLRCQQKTVRVRDGIRFGKWSLCEIPVSHQKFGGGVRFVGSGQNRKRCEQHQSECQQCSHSHKHCCRRIDHKQQTFRRISQHSASHLGRPRSQTHCECACVDNHGKCHHPQSIDQLFYCELICSICPKSIASIATSSTNSQCCSYSSTNISRVCFECQKLCKFCKYLLDRISLFM